MARFSYTMYSFFNIILFYHVYHGMIYLHNVFILPYYCILLRLSWHYLAIQCIHFPILLCSITFIMAWCSYTMYLSTHIIVLAWFLLGHYQISPKLFIQDLIPWNCKRSSKYCHLNFKARATILNQAWVYNFFICSTQLRTKFILQFNNCWHYNIYQQDKYTVWTL